MKYARAAAAAFFLSMSFFAYYRIYQVKFPFDIVLPWIFYFPLLGLALGPLIPGTWLERPSFSWAFAALTFVFLYGTLFNQNVSLHVFVSRTYYPYPPPPDFYFRVASLLLSFAASAGCFACASAPGARIILESGNKRAVSACVVSALCGFLAATFAILAAGAYKTLFFGVLCLVPLVAWRDKKALVSCALATILLGAFFSSQRDVFLLWRAGYNYKKLHTQWTPYYYLNFISFNDDRCLGGVYNYLMLWIVCKDTNLIEKELKFFHSEISKGKESALVIGRAEGATFLTLDYPEPHLKRGTAVEIDPVVPEMVSGAFSEYNQNVYKRKGFKAVAMDWRAFLRKDTEKYDLAVWDGLGIRLVVEPFTNFFQEDYLYTKESLEQVFKERLNENGIFAGNWGSTQAVEIYPLLANVPKDVHKIAFWTTFNDYPLMGLPVLLFAASRDKKRLDEIAAALREIKPFQEIPTDVDMTKYEFTDDKPFLQKFIQPPLVVIFLPLLLAPLALAATQIQKQKKERGASGDGAGCLLFGALYGLLFTLFMSRNARLAHDGGAAYGIVILMAAFLLSSACAWLLPLRRNGKRALLFAALPLFAVTGVCGMFTSRAILLTLSCFLGFFSSLTLRFLPRPSGDGAGAAASLLGLGFVAGNLLAQIVPWILGYRLSGMAVAAGWVLLYFKLGTGPNFPAQKHVPNL